MSSDKPPVCLTIAGSDSGGGAGIQADLKTFAALGVYGCSVITAVTAQNTRAVRGVWPQTVSAVKEQIDTVLADFNVKAIKLGMLCSAPIVETIGSTLERHPHLPVVYDPVMVSTNGASLAGEAMDKERLVQAVCKHLLPKVTLLTPNIDEAALLLEEQLSSSQKKAQTLDDMRVQSKTLIESGSNAVLITGGHLPLAFDSSELPNNGSRGGIGKNNAVDVLYWREPDGIKEDEFFEEFIDSNNTHGTGCTLSSAIAAQLAQGYSLLEAITQAKQYVHGAIVAAKNLTMGSGNGPLHHFYKAE